MIATFRTSTILCMAACLPNGMAKNPEVSSYPPSFFSLEVARSFFSSLVSLRIAMKSLELNPCGGFYGDLN